MVSKSQNVCPQNPIFTPPNALLCDEQEQDLGFECGFGLVDQESQTSQEKDSGSGCGFDQESQILKRNDNLFTHFERDLLWGEDDVSSLLSREGEKGEGGLVSDGVLMVLRRESIDWMVRVSTHYGFVPVTTILAVGYFDRFLLGPCFQREKPWMSQLAAVACLSLAAKVEEVHTPLLLDLQVEGSKFVFESKTIMRMELLLLSSLQWKMNLVTPLTFFDSVVQRLGLATHHLILEFERIILSVINDSRFLSYRPSVIAAATMCLAFKEVEPRNALNYRNRLMGVLKINEEKVNDCSKFILEASSNHRTSQSINHKRKYRSAPGSPSGVTDAYFPSDNSNDSWAVPPSPEPPFKRNRVQERQMRLAPVNRGGNPH